MIIKSVTDPFTVGSTFHFTLGNGNTARTQQNLSCRKDSKMDPTTPNRGCLIKNLFFLISIH